MNEPLRHHRWEVILITRSAHTERLGIVGLTGTITSIYDDGGDGRRYGVTVPRRRHQHFTLSDDEMEGTGRSAEREPESHRTSLRVGVDPKTGRGSLLDRAGVAITVDDGASGLALFTFVSVLDPAADEDEDLHEGVVVAKARRADGTWRYIVLLENQRVLLVHDGHELDPAFWTEPGHFLDHPLPKDADTIKRAEGLDFLAAWNAPPPVFGYDQQVRVLARAHTDALAGRTGSIRSEDLSDDLRWSYWVLFDDDEASEFRSVTVGEEDLEATGLYGEGYNPAPGALRRS